MIRCSVILMAMPVIMAERGVLELDNTTFGRVVGGSLPALVRFDTANSYGDAADAWQTMAVDIGKTDAAVLLCDVLLEESYAGSGRGRGSDYGHDEDEYPRDEEEEANRDGEEDEAGSVFNRPFRLGRLAVSCCTQAVWWARIQSAATSRVSLTDQIRYENGTKVKFWSKPPHKDVSG